MPHVDNVIFLKVSLPFCYSTQQKTILGNKNQHLMKEWIMHNE